MDRDPVSKQQLRFDRSTQRRDHFEEGPNAGDTFVGGFVIGGVLGALIVWLLERL